MNRQDIARKVTEYIHAVLKARHDTDNIFPDTALISSGKLDSLDIINLITFLEENFNLSFADKPFDAYAFDTVEKVIEVIENQCTK